APSIIGFSVAAGIYVSEIAEAIPIVRRDILRKIPVLGEYWREEETQTYKFFVEMTCGGCKNSVASALKKVDGIESVDIDLAEKLVTVNANATITKEDVLATIKKTGKHVYSIE
ncbi:912_t:CDS:2, partial [Ambispora leptoticha]